MIPKIIHSCWFGHGTKPELVEKCIASWRRYMPEAEGWVYMEWNEDSITEVCAKKNLQSPILNLKYCQEAYAAGKYAFASDYIRLWALEQYGGIYLDTDVEMLRSYEALLNDQSFIGFEESKAKTLGTNVIGAEPHCLWIQEMLEYYQHTPFIKEDGSLDMTANSELIARLMETKGLVRNGVEQMVDGLHVYDYHYFSPITSTRVMRKNKNTYSIHHCYGSWTDGSKSNRIRNTFVVRELINALIQIKRLIVR